MTRNLICCCCGAQAGRWQQHWNRDTGYGLCAKCAAWIPRRWPETDMEQTFGKVGVNYAPSTGSEG